MRNVNLITEQADLQTLLGALADCVGPLKILENCLMQRQSQWCKSAKTVERLLSSLDNISACLPLPHSPAISGVTMGEMCAQWSLEYRCHVSYLLITSQLIMQFHFSTTSHSLIPDRITSTPHLAPATDLSTSVPLSSAPILSHYSL